MWSRCVFGRALVSLLVVSFSIAFASVAHSQGRPEEEAPAPSVRSFDVFGDEEASDAPSDDPEKDALEIEGEEDPPTGEVDETSAAGAPPAASVGDRVLVLVVPDHPRELNLAHRIGREATLRLARERRYAAVELEEALVPGMKEAAEREIRSGLQGVKSGILAFEELDLDKAGADLELSINTLLSHLDDLGKKERRALERAIFAYGATTLFEGQTELAESIFVALLLLTPNYRPDTRRFPSNVITRYEDLQREVEQRPTGGLFVTTTPSGAEIHVDGSVRGSSPIEVGGLADGQHVVIAKRVGFKPYGTLAPVTRDRMSSVEIDLESASARDPLERLTPDLAGSPLSAIEMGKSLEVDRLAVLLLETPLSGSRVSGLWVDVRTGSLLGRFSTDIVNDPGVAAQKIVAAIAKAEGDQLVPASLETERSRDAPGVLEAWWFWTVVGGAVIALASIGVAAARGGGEEGPRTRDMVVLGF